MSHTGDAAEAGAPAFSLVIPCYNESAGLPELVRRCAYVAGEGMGEIVLVDYGWATAAGLLALATASAARNGERYLFHWAVLAIMFVGLSADEATGTAYLVTKSQIGASVVYRLPARSDPNRVQTLVRVATIAFRAHAAAGPLGALGTLTATGAALSHSYCPPECT